jgi:hypothetical protein
VTSRDDIQYLSDGQEVYVSSDYTLYSDGMMQTSWSGFKLDDVINMEVVFRAARVTSIINSPINAAISLDKLIINIGQAWDACNSQFGRAQNWNLLFVVERSFSEQCSTRHRSTSERSR